MKTSIIKKAIAGITATLTLGTASAMLAPVSSFAANQTAQEACDTARYYKNNPSKYSHSSSAWCAEFAVDCIKASGVNMSGLASNSTNALLTNFYNRDHSSYHSRSGSEWRTNYPNPKPVIDTNYTPQPGDLAFVQNYWGDPEPDHTALVVSVSGTGINATVTTIEGNMSGTIKEMTYTNGEYTSKSYHASIYGYATPSYKKTSSVSTLKGDLDLNGKVDVTDCTHLSLYLTEWHEVEIDRMIKHMSAMYKPFNLEDIIRDTDLVFSGTVISRKEYEVQWTDNNGEIWGPYRNGVIEVSVGEVYYGHTDKEIIRIYYPNSFSLKSSGAFLINDNQEYIFMANAFDADFFAEKAANPNDRFEQHKHADVYINGSRSDIMPVKNGIASVFNGYFKDNEEALSRALPKEEVIGSIPDEARSAGWFLFYRKEDLTKLLMELFSRK